MAHAIDKVLRHSTYRQWVEVKWSPVENAYSAVLWGSDRGVMEDGVRATDGHSSIAAIGKLLAKVRSMEAQGE